ncbi:retrovirus-related pol polyprotein from transposon TNT 1-94 [Tanacetum coccineum]
MLIISTISEASFCHVQGITSCDLWLSLKKAYAPHSISREYTLKTQLLRIEMHGDETPDAYLNRAQEYADVLAAIGEPVKDKDLVMLAVSGLREEYNSLKTAITARQSPTAFSELHALLSDHDYMFGKTRAPAPYITSSFAANYAHSDTGANSHVTPDLEAMDNSEAYYGDDALHVGNGKGLPILHIGSSKVYSPQKMFSLKNILHVQEISHNLLSVHKFCHDNDVFFEFHTSYFVVKDESTHTTLLTSSSKHGLYTITLPQLKSINKVSFSAIRASPTIWHRRLGQPRQRLLRSMLSNFSLPVTNKSLSSFCNSCPLGKSSKLPLFESGFQSHNILDLVYCDVWGPAPLLSFEAMKEVYDALMKNETWSLVPHASNTNVVDGIDFHETFSPVVKSTTIRVFLSLAVTNNWPLCQLDIQNAFLHGNLKEQAPRAWFERLSKALFDLGFKGSKTDPSLFIYSRGDTLLYILVYVDDIIVTGNNKGTIDNIICQLGFAFALKDLGSLNYFLGIEIVPHVSGILLSQKKYILELLQSAGLSNCKPVSSPMVTSSSLSLDDSTAFSNPVKYRQVVGNPDTSLEAFSDADWAGDSDDRRSMGGFSIYLGSNLLSWTACKQRTVSRSSTEAEYKALANTVAKLTWL